MTRHEWNEVGSSRRQIEKVTAAISEKQSAAVEAFCRLLVEEKGPRSVLDYELVQQQEPGSMNMRWYFQKKRVEGS